MRKRDIVSEKMKYKPSIATTKISMSVSVNFEQGKER